MREQGKAPPGMISDPNFLAATAPRFFLMINFFADYLKGRGRGEAL